MARKARKKPYDPTGPSFKNQRGFRRAVRRRSRQTIQPLLNDVEQRGNEAESAHQNRQKELEGWYGHAQTAATTGQDRLQSALQGLASATTGFQGDVGAALNAALRKSTDVEAAQAANLGVAGPQVDPRYAAAQAAYSGAGQMGLGGDIVGLLGRGSADIGIRGLEGREAGEREIRRYGGVQEGLADERKGIMGQLPGIRAQMRGEINAEELAKQQGRFQQGLANKEFGLSEKQFRLQRRGQRFQEDLADRQQDETERAGKHARRIDRGNLGVARDQLAIQREQIVAESLRDQQSATNTAELEEAKSRAKRFDNAATWLDSYLQPSSADEGKKGNFNEDKYKARTSFDAALNSIKQRFGLGDRAALMVMSTASNTGWSKEALKRMETLFHEKRYARRRRQGEQGGDKATN